uniref:26S proteasome non-ATPase regulatory subunit 9 n=1 Tax=Setaria digitata TaxID=48799 RepID=A0A915PSG5_9BILA
MEREKNGGKKVTTIEEVKKLIAERDEIDRRIAKEEEVLRINNIDMKKSLVDEEGYPITSVDVYSVRQARSAIICAHNDRQKLTSRIEEAMLALHQQKRNCAASCSEHALTEATPVVHRTSNAPFARIAKVMPSSPAFRAGLKDGDQLIQFGSLHAGNFSDMKDLCVVVQNSVDRPIKVTVLRDDRPIRLELVPQAWSGKGTLGCSVLPVTPSHI